MTTFISAIIASPKTVAGLPSHFFPTKISTQDQIALRALEAELNLAKMEGDPYQFSKDAGVETVAVEMAQVAAQSPDAYSQAADLSAEMSAVADRVYGSRTRVFTDMRRLFQEWEIQYTPWNRQIYLLGASVDGLSLAIDLDGTLMDVYEERGDRSSLVQLKPGSEAWLAGLVQRNSVLLYTPREATFVAALLEISPILQRVFLKQVLQPPILPRVVRNSHLIFSRSDWIEVMTNILERAATLEESGELTLLEERVLNLWDIVEGQKISTQPVKHPEFPGILGKRNFDFLIENGDGVQERLRILDAAIPSIQLPDAPPPHSPSALDQRHDDLLLRAALLLYRYTKEGDIEIPDKISETRRATWVEPIQLRITPSGDPSEAAAFKRFQSLRRERQVRKGHR